MIRPSRESPVRVVRDFRHFRLRPRRAPVTVVSPLGTVEEGQHDHATAIEVLTIGGRLQRPLRRRHLMPAIMVLLLLAGCGGSSTPTSRSTAAAFVDPPTGSWTASEPVSSAGPFSNLAWVQCNGNANCYADGLEQGRAVFSDFLQHWDGHAWTSSVGPAGTGVAPALGELDCLPSGFCVVPLAVNTVSIYSVVAGAWAAMPSDDPTSPARPDATVNAVACFSETRCVAVGAVGSSTATSPLALVWNGSRWKSTVLSPQGRDRVQSLLSVSCGSSSSCIAVGYTARGSADTTTGHTAIAVRWDGSTWTPLAVPGATHLDDVVCISRSSCIAVGDKGAGGILLHWTGGKWVEEHSPLAGQYFAVNCASEDLCMALQRPNRPLGRVPMAIRWYGRWFKVTGYPAPVAYLDGVSCYSGGCLVVGQSRATPSASASDVAGAQSTAAFYDIKAGHATTTSSSSTSTSNASAASPAPIIGLWTGRVTQQGSGAAPQTYEVEMAVKPTATGTLIGRTVYPSLNCAGNLQPRSAHGNSYVFHEQITVGRKQCSSGGTIFATVSGNSLSWRWVANGIQVVGVLHRALSHVTITGAFDTTLLGDSQCYANGGTHVIELRGYDKAGGSVVVSVSDQQTGGFAQVSRGLDLYKYEGKGRLIFTGTRASLTHVVMAPYGPFGTPAGAVTVNGILTC